MGASLGLELWPWIYKPCWSSVQSTVNAGALAPTAASCLSERTSKRIRALLPQSSDNAADPPCTQQGHHGGHNQHVFPWFHDRLQRRDQVIQRRRDGGW